MREQRPREREARRPTGGGEVPEVANADEAAREHVLDQAPEKLHHRQAHRARLPVVGVVLPLKGDPLPVEGAQAVIADRHAMRVAPKVAQHRRGAPEGWLGIDHPVGVEERVNDGAPVRRVPQVLAAPARSSSSRSYARRSASTYFPRKTRLRTFTGKKKPAHRGRIHRW